MAEYRRLILYFALALLGFSLWSAWQRDYPAKPAVSTTASAVPSEVAAQTPSTAADAAKAQTATVKSVTGQIIKVQTDTLNVSIDTLGGNIVSVTLPKFPKSTEERQTPVQLLNTNPDTLYIAQSGLLSEAGPDTAQGQTQYSVDKLDYALQPNQNSLVVKLTSTNKQGLEVNKIFTFKRGDYAINVSYQITNGTKQPWTGQMYGQLQQKPEKTSAGIFSLHTYIGAALSSPEKPYDKVSFSSMQDENVNRTVKGGWLAYQQRYFLSTWIPNQSELNHYYSSATTDNIYTLGYIGPKITVPAGQQLTTGANFYAGPEIAENLKALAPHLNLTIDYGWLWPISLGIFWIMKHIHKVVGNWGWSIVLVTLLIKLLFYKLSETSYRSMARMRQLTPRLQALKERYGDDRQKMSQATMELYRKEKVNPLGGCLPMIIQIPFFIALYYVLVESVQLRQAPFIFWIHDLSSKDPYFVLPILMGLSMFIQQKLNPPPPDPVQAKVMLLLPVMFTVFFLAFPSGLVLYWLVNNCLSVLQQWYIMRRFAKA